MLGPKQIAWCRAKFPAFDALQEIGERIEAEKAAMMDAIREQQFRDRDSDRRQWLMDTPAEMGMDKPEK